MYQLGNLIYIFLLGIILGRSSRKEKATKKRTFKGYIPKTCPICKSEIKEIPGGVSKRTGRKYRTFWVCSNKECSFTCNKTFGGFKWSWEKEGEKYQWSGKKIKKAKKQTNNAIKNQARAIVEEIQEWQDPIEEIVSGQLKMKAPKVSKTDWLETLGRGNYMRIFGGGMFAPTPDELANDLGITEDELKRRIAQRLNN